MTIIGSVILSNPNDGSDVEVVQVRCSCKGTFYALKTDFDSGEVQSCGDAGASRMTLRFQPKLTRANRIQRIRTEAYYQWLAEGKPIDDGKARWLTAEKRVNAEFPQ